MTECNPVFERFINKIGLSNASATIDGDELWATTIVALVQFLDFNFSSNHFLSKSRFIFLQRYKKYQSQKNKTHFYPFIFLKLHFFIEKR